MSAHCGGRSRLSSNVLLSTDRRIALGDFDIVFERLEEVRGEIDEHQNEGEDDRAAVTAEYDEIDELRRFAADLNDPEQPSFTTT